MTNALAGALRKHNKGWKVPVPWQSLAILEPLRGNLVLALGQPGVGKSALALNWALKISEPSLVLSLDTDLTTQAIRTASVLSGRSMDTVKADPSLWASYLDKKANLMRVYDLNLDGRGLMGLIKAEEEYWGIPPALTIVDNISNLTRDGGYEEYRKIFVDLHRVARLTNTCIFALHHVSRGPQAGQPLNLQSGQYAGEQEAEMVLGLWAKHEDYLNISVLKNRSGKADAKGNLYTTITWNRASMDLTDMTEQHQVRAVLEGAL